MALSVVLVAKCDPVLPELTVRENVCNNSKNRKKSCFFGFWKKR